MRTNTVLRHPRCSTNEFTCLRLHSIPGHVGVYQLWYAINPITTIHLNEVNQLTEVVHLLSALL
jgi:hypothetical protein